MCAIMKMSFEEEYRRAMNELGLCLIPSLQFLVQNRRLIAALRSQFQLIVVSVLVLSVWFSSRLPAGGGRSHPPRAGNVRHAERPHQHGPAPLRWDGSDQPHLRRCRQQGTV